ncbi:GNAT family N-acetyltransferase [Paenibacillus lutrae]|uniref:GNAT family N-acetyltransferase n=1 Tax=Paenibacillus lutrae TaxID=2078573 RepID=A0A7X3FKJ5_9BACL|nr:GNAT family N-acetyltransferase [Paenibacillus lutrae]MVP01189.1 GNAT family N-acetyltransferase [Paenibacillus lutrae]
MITFVPHLPHKTELYQLFQTTGWDGIIQLSESKIYEAVSTSWFTVSAYHHQDLVGFGRVLSDGVFQSFICDLIVHPGYQKQGIGSSVLKALLLQCKNHHIVSVQLCCAQGKAEFYKKFGFMQRSSVAPGMYWLNRDLG